MYPYYYSTTFYFETVLFDRILNLTNIYYITKKLIYQLLYFKNKKNSFDKPYGCSKCNSKIRIFFGRNKVIFETKCYIPPTNYSTITTLPSTFEGNYYGDKKKTSTTKISIPLMGNYSGFPIPVNSNISIAVTYKKPLSNPFKVASCTATTTNPSAGTCNCTVCGTSKNEISNIQFNCATLILIPNATYPDQTSDIYYPDTSTNCFDPVALLFQNA